MTLSRTFITKDWRTECSLFLIFYISCLSPLTLIELVDEMSSRIEDLEKSIGELVQNVEEDPKTPPTSKPSTIQDK
jgi:hypothetical protein